MSTVSNSLWSPEMQIMFRPAAAYQRLAGTQSPAGKWWAMKRPLIFIFILACTVSFTATGRLTLRLIIPAMINACIEILIQALALAATRTGAQKLPFSRAFALYFAGFGPWLFWFVAFAAIWIFALPEHAFRWTGPRYDGYVIAAFVFWTAYVDFCFFRYIFQITPRNAFLKLLTQRAISWIPAAIIFGGGSLWPEIIRSLTR